MLWTLPSSGVCKIFNSEKWRNIFLKFFSHFLLLKNIRNIFSHFLVLKKSGNIFSHFSLLKIVENFQSLFTVEKFNTHVSTSFFLSSKMKSHLTWSWALGSQIWFKNWFSNAPIFFSCGPIFTSTVSKIFSLDRRIHFGTSWHPQMCHSYLKQTQQSWKKLKISPNPWFRSTANLLS